jgi:hypothetical protein
MRVKPLGVSSIACMTYCGSGVVLLCAEARVDGAVVAAGQVTKTVLRQG